MHHAHFGLLAVNMLFAVMNNKQPFTELLRQDKPSLTPNDKDRTAVRIYIYIHNHTNKAVTETCRTAFT
jgi:hypothetical protein